jgi:DNA-binding MarR family transcriptional regulator
MGADSVKARLHETESVTTWRLLERVYSVLHKRLELRLAELGLTQSQAAILSVLAAAEQPLPLSQIARNLEQEPQRMTWVMDRLETRGLVRRVPHPTDRRVVHVHLTPIGATLGQRAEETTAKSLAQVLGILDSQALRCLTDALQRLQSEAAFPNLSEK